MEEVFYSINHRMMFLNVWERILTQRQKERLGMDVTRCFSKYKGTVALWEDLYGLSQPEAIIRLARKIGVMTPSTSRWLYREVRRLDPTLLKPRLSTTTRRDSEEDEDLEEKIALAIQSHLLVLVEGNGHFHAYWKGQPVKQKWDTHQTMWNLLWKLAQTALQGSYVAWDILEGKPSVKKIKDRRSKLKRILPDDLNALIKPFGPGSYQLKLRRAQIRLFQLEQSDVLFTRDDFGGIDEAIGRFPRSHPMSEAHNCSELIRSSISP